MKIRELFEDAVKHVTFCFGRMNPPTIGHKQVLDTMSKQGGEMKIFVSQSQDPKKNPLDYSTKVKFIKAMFPDYAADVVEDSSLNTVVKVASYLYDQGYTAATFVAGSDRLDDMKKLLEAYNGVEGKSHGYYKFEVLDFVNSGDREDGAEGVAGVSASGARAAAANGDLEAFKEATGAGELSQKLYDAVRKGMGINEDIDARIDVDRLITKLDDERMKDVIEMRFKHNMTYQQIGKELGVNPETVRVIEARALRKLRQMSASLPI
jgi:RNA polymerase sigma factor (sigma-70 family)